MDPKQWAKDLPTEVRDVLDAGASLGAPSGARQAVWSALAAKLPAATVAASTGGMTALSVLKPLAAGLLFGALASVGVIELRSKTAASPQAAVGISSPNATLAPVRPRPAELTSPPLNEPARPDSLTSAQSSKTTSAPGPAEKLPASAARSAAALVETAPVTGTASVAAFPDQAPPARHEDRTLLESRRLNQARASLQAGDARSALTQLDAIAVDFPSGVLVQELDVLRIEAMLELGERQRARELALRFLEIHPKSPHAAAVERALH